MYRAHPEFQYWRVLLSLWCSACIVAWLLAERETDLPAFAVAIGQIVALNVSFLTFVFVVILWPILKAGPEPVGVDGKLAKRRSLEGRDMLVGSLVALFLFFATLVGSSSVEPHAVTFLLGFWWPIAVLLPYTLLCPKRRRLPARLVLLVIIALSPWLSLPLASLAEIGFRASIRPGSAEWCDEAIVGIFFDTVWICAIAPAVLGGAWCLSGRQSKGDGRLHLHWLWSGLVVSCCLWGIRFVMQQRIASP
jgi:hypothetical protein